MDNIVWIFITAGLSVITLFSLTAMLIMRSRERAYSREDESAKTACDKIDVASDSALEEINRTARLALDEINEKYQAMMFLYGLLDTKKKEISALTEFKPANKKPGEAPASAERRARQAEIKKSARYERIAALKREGLSVPEIAKRLDIGQGEVQLTIGLAERAGGVNV